MKVESAVMDLVKNKQKITDRQFDHELNTMVGSAIMGGVNPAVMIGCLTMAIQDIYNWKIKNDEAVKKLHADLQKAAPQIHIVDSDGKLGDILQSQTPPAVGTGQDNDGVLIRE